MPRSSFTKHGVLGAAFQACRALQFACLIAAIGLSAHLTSQLLPSRPPAPIIGALTTACFAALYTLISYLLYFDAQLPTHLGAAADTLCFIALSATAGILGTPISCNIAPAPAAAAFDPTKAFTEAPPPAAAADAIPYLTPESGTVYHLRARFVVAEVGYAAWVRSSEGTCVMVQCVWGLAVVAAVLFVVSGLCLGGLWWRERTVRREEMMEEGEYKI